ncbi:unnamed protein product, partial [Hymenolepis diminuta]
KGGTKTVGIVKKSKEPIGTLSDKRVTIRKEKERMLSLRLLESTKVYEEFCNVFRWKLTSRPKT